MMNTGFLNVKRRAIMKTERGAYVVMTSKGPKYNPKVKYYKNPAGSTVHIKYVKNTVAIPSPIRPKIERKVRKNAGEARGQYKPRIKGVRVLPMKRKAYITELEMGHAPKRGRGRPRKVKLVSPGGNMGLARLFGERKRGRPKKMLYKVKFAGQYVA